MRSRPSLKYYPGIRVCVSVCVGMRNDKWGLHVAESWPQITTNTNRVTEHLTVTFDRDIKNRGWGCGFASTYSWQISLLFWCLALGLTFILIPRGRVLPFILMHRVVFFCTQTYENMPSNCNSVSHSATCLDMKYYGGIWWVFISISFYLHHNFDILTYKYNAYLLF